MKTPDAAVEAIARWFAALPGHGHTGGLPARGSVAVGLVVLERLKTNLTFDVDEHRAKGGAQIQGLNPSAVMKIQRRFGEDRPLLKEGGRTNRGTPLAVESLFEALRPLGLDRLEFADRTHALNVMQEWLVRRISDYFNRKRIPCEFDPQLSTWANLRNLLGAAGQVGKASSVAQYLVGAKLQLRFPELPIENQLVSAADDPSGRSGDFEIGDTVFHVTIAPGVAVAEKCRKNLSQGKRAVLIVPENTVLSARDYVQHACADRVFVVSVETFIASNLEELSTFRQAALVSGMRRLLEVYNERVDAIELDKSVLIEIPPNLR